MCNGKRTYQYKEDTFTRALYRDWETKWQLTKLLYENWIDGYKYYGSYVNEKTINYVSKYIRPITLFGNKFEQYLEEPWADGRINEKYDPEKHVKFTRWESLPKKTQYGFSCDRKYYEDGRNGIAGSVGKTVFWTDDPEDYEKYEREGL